MDRREQLASLADVLWTTKHGKDIDFRKLFIRTMGWSWIEDYS